MTTKFIPNAGGSIASSKFLNGSSALGWAFREPSVAPEDNGWRFMSQDDDADFVNTPGNMQLADFNRVAEIEPLVLAIYDFPVGSDFMFVQGADGSRKFVDSATHEDVELPARS
ncbi:DUF2185 domain-containing protein [Frondihabitans sp. 4ASC-45]|uniref:immunity protein Imm33 domain-containing protein n=1 Tax=Frondihabitans sp. 4ASC-45 TaxID=3111636 RepID=UPI003C1FC8C5